MNRSTAGLIAFALLASSTAQAAEPGFYFGVAGSRVEREVTGRPGTAIAVFTSALPNPVLPPVGGIIIRPPPGSVVPPIFFGQFPTVILPNSVDVDEVDAGFSATVGYRVNRYLAAELTYADFGEFQIIERYSFGNVDYELGVRGPSVSVLGTLPLGEQWELFLRGGVLFADQQVSLGFSGSSTGGPPDLDYSDEVITAGAGVQWSFATRWAARLEYQRTGDMKYDNTGESSLEQASLSVMFKL
ncbi:MAG: outer membrane beta-barrel protein [Steroidobacter sp.]